MKFIIGVRGIKDKSLENTIMKTFEYFATINKQRGELIEKNKIRKEINLLLQELVDYVEIGLKRKYSVNFTVIISENPAYALKYEKGCLMSVSYLHYDILVFKVPYITIPSKFHLPSLSSDEINKITIKKNSLKDLLLVESNYQMINYIIKNRNNQMKGDLSLFKQDNITDIIFKCISFCQLQIKDKDFTITLAQAIQYELANLYKDYNFCVIISKDIIISPAFLATSNLVYQSKFIAENDLKECDLNKIKNHEILIYHKHCEFESALKNIISGRFQSVELKHIFILLSVIIFFTLVGFCGGDQEFYANKVDLSWFEENVCRNKSSYLSTIGVLFIMIVLSGVLKKRMNKPKK